MTLVGILIEFGILRTMTPEEYKRIKEAELEHQRALKKLKTKLREVQRQNKVAAALKDIQNAPGDEIVRTHEEMIDRLAMDTVQGEARLEMALSESDEEASVNPVEDGEELQQKVRQSDAELKKIRAQELVRQIKLQMGLADVRKKQEESPAATHDDSSHKESKDTGKEKGKTLDSTPREGLPEKTIGRIPRKKS